MANAGTTFYELYRQSSIGVALTDTLDDLISAQVIEPQLAMKIIANFDKAFMEMISERVKSRLTFRGSLDTYRFCDDVWTFLIKDVTFKLDNQASLRADKVKIVSCTNKKGETRLIRSSSVPASLFRLAQEYGGRPIKEKHDTHTKKDDEAPTKREDEAPTEEKHEVALNKSMRRLSEGDLHESVTSRCNALL